MPGLGAPPIMPGPGPMPIMPGGIPIIPMPGGIPIIIPASCTSHSDSPNRAQHGHICRAQHRHEH